MVVRIEQQDFDISAEIAGLIGGNTDVGAIATFTGLVRGEAGGKPLAGMSLEHYPGMTEAELAHIEQQAVERFGLQASLIVHRVGPLIPGDNIVLVIACAAHRQAAFDACNYLMDYLKTRAPFWKKETPQGEEGHWVDARDADDEAALRWTKTER